MKVLLFHTWRIIDSKGGTEKVLCNMANELYKRGYDVTVLVTENKDGKPFYKFNKEISFQNVGLISRITKMMINFKGLFCFSKINRHKFRNEYICKLIAKRVESVLIDIEPDVIICFSKQATHYCKCMLKANIPTITMFHFNSEYILKDPKFFTALEKTDCIQVLLNREVMITKKQLVPQKMVTIPNVVLQHNDYCKYRNNTIINIGRFDKVQKRQHLLLEAFALLKDKYPQWKVEIWGEQNYDADYYNEMKLFVKNNKLENIYFCGTTDDVNGRLKESSIFACTSAFEGFGLALTEAMSMGLPSIGFKDATSVNELIKDGRNGILCEETVEDFARGLAELMDDADKRKRYGLQAKEDMKQYAPEKIWDQWEELINNTVHDYKKNN